MLRFIRSFLLLAGLLCLGFATHAGASAPATPLIPTPVLKIDGLGKGTAPLDGPWQFHIGDNAAWALPGTPDATGSDGWEQIIADATWGAQGHPAYAGVAWYRKHLHLTPAPGAASGPAPSLGTDFALLIPQIDDVYEIYWNGQQVGRHGTMPPNPSYPYLPPQQIFGLGAARDGVLAVRVWKAPLTSFDPAEMGGFNSPPLVGSQEAIAAAKTQNDYSWMRRLQYRFGQYLLYGLIAVVGVLMWLRNRAQYVLLAVAAYCGAQVCAPLVSQMRLPIPQSYALGWLQPILALKDIGLWFLLLYLFRLDRAPRLTRFTRILAIVNLTSASLDGMLTLCDWSNPFFARWVQTADGLLTVVTVTTEVYPLVLIAFALRRRLDQSRWFLAIAATIDALIAELRNTLDQGSRYTHWNFLDKLSDPLFTLNGNSFTPISLADTLLLAAIVYAVYHAVREATQRQSAMERELQSARELQQVLIPEALPELKGYAVTSAYVPAQEVGGDFFQIIPLEGTEVGSTLIVLGDVSGKGLQAAMTVSLIVGAVRTVASFTQSPARILAELNERLHGRLKGGFATCVVLRLDAGGQCTLASAGHPAPVRNDKEMELPGALPLGILPGAAYEEIHFMLGEGDRLALYTDGLLEARDANGELFGFTRLDKLFAEQGDAAKAAGAAVSFGQEDDITVLTMTRLATGEQARTQLSAPILAAANA
jgi:serine phosphatase RsbU (regulator of sigma subunit)